MSTSRHPEVTSITAVPASMAEDQGRRLRQYLVQMSIRLVLILLAALLVEGWLLWVCIAGAIVLPYTAVIFANAGRDRSARETSTVPPAPPSELPAAPSPREDDQIRIVEHDEDPDSTDRKDT